MIPRQIPIPDDVQIRPRSAWAALILAHQHKIDQEAEGETWTCVCRCCRFFCAIAEEEMTP